MNIDTWASQTFYKTSTAVWRHHNSRSRSTNQSHFFFLQRLPHPLHGRRNGRETRLPRPRNKAWSPPIDTVLIICVVSLCSNCNLNFHLSSNVSQENKTRYWQALRSLPLPSRGCREKTYVIKGHFTYQQFKPSSTRFYFRIKTSKALSCRCSFRYYMWPYWQFWRRLECHEKETMVWLHSIYHSSVLAHAKLPVMAVSHDIMTRWRCVCTILLKPWRQSLESRISVGMSHRKRAWRLDYIEGKHFRTFLRMTLSIFRWCGMSWKKKGRY